MRGAVERDVCWAMHYRLLSRFSLAALILVGCLNPADTTPGRFDVVFHFEGEAPDPQTQALWAWAKVEEWAAGMQSGPRLAETDTVPFGFDAQLEFGRVPNGGVWTSTSALRRLSDAWFPAAWR